MTADRNPTDDRLNDFLDGAMTDQEQTEFKRRLEADPELRAEVESQAAIDDSLNRLFAPSPEGVVKVNIPTDEQEPPLRLSDSATPPNRSTAPPMRRRLAFLAAAASITAGTLAVWSMFQTFKTPDGYQQIAERSLDELFDDAVAKNFAPEWVCADDAEFASTFNVHYHQPLLLESELPSGIETTGLAYCNTLSDSTTCVLAKVDDSGVVVLVDRVELDSCPQPARTQKGRYVHRRQLGILVLYEVSPYAEPRLLEYFYEPETPAPGSGSSHES